jgi:beta-hydroxylase
MPRLICIPDHLSQQMDPSVLVVAALEPRFLILAGFLASASYVHFRGRRRHGLLRQLTDQSTFLAPLNCLIYAASAVPGRPVLDAGQFPALKPLQDNWRVFRDEALALYDSGRIRASDHYDDLGFNSFFRHGWKRFYLKWYDEPLPSATALCPRSVELLQQVGIVKGAMFALLEAGGTLNEHRDPYAGSLRLHLGLSTPNDDRCRIYIDGEPYSWRDGQALMFDETYVHRAVNETTQDRIILFCDVERPLRVRFAERINDFICRHVMRETATRNAEGDRVGVCNRVFAHVYRIRLLGKRLKTWNRPLYYLVKCALIGGFLALLLI